MLTQLVIKNFAVVKHLEVEFDAQMTAITGETGAGKSIAIDALGLCLGDRADANMVRSDADKLEVSATFSVLATSSAKTWLSEQALDSEDECVIRRVVTKEGRSKAYINGSPVSLQQLKSLASFLLSIHGQNAHHRLLKEDNQRAALDHFGKHQPLLKEVQHAFYKLKDTQKTLNELKQAQQTSLDRKNLLEYQVEELDEFALGDGEFTQLESEFKKLSHSQHLLEQSQSSYQQLYENDEVNALDLVKYNLDKLLALKEHDECLAPIVEMLQESVINIEEASHELRNYSESLELDPERQIQVEQRYNKTIELSRKHQVLPEQLASYHQTLKSELAGLASEQDMIASLEAELVTARSAYSDAAKNLSHARQNSAPDMAELILSYIKKMNMPDAKLHFEVTTQPDAQASVHGLDTISIMVSPNPGQLADKMEKVLSGGELSRVGLAIQVISSSENDVPTLIFDEVDTGISGPTASVVGQLLRQLGSKQQVMCVTHLPQVAAQAHHQMFVDKVTSGESTETTMVSLTEKDRTNEIARLLAGDKVTDSALANARELLTQKVA